MKTLQHMIWKLTTFKENIYIDYSVVEFHLNILLVLQRINNLHFSSYLSVITVLFKCISLLKIQCIKSETHHFDTEYNIHICSGIEINVRG